MFTFRLLRNEADAFKIMQELFQNKQNNMEHPVCMIVGLTGQRRRVKGKLPGGEINRRPFLKQQFFKV